MVRYHPTPLGISEAGTFEDILKPGIVTGPDSAIAKSGGTIASIWYGSYLSRGLLAVRMRGLYPAVWVELHSRNHARIA